NDAGVVTGSITFQTDAGATQNPVNWIDGKRTGLPLPKSTLGAGPYGINGQGESFGSAETDAGTEAVVWLGGRALFVKDLVDAEDWTFIAAKDISDGGAIVGYGALRGEIHGVVLT